MAETEAKERVKEPGRHCEQDSLSLTTIANELRAEKRHGAAGR